MRWCYEPDALTGRAGNAEQPECRTKIRLECRTAGMQNCNPNPNRFTQFSIPALPNTLDSAFGGLAFQPCIRHSVPALTMEPPSQVIGSDSQSLWIFNS